MAQGWSRRGNDYDLKLDGIEHSQLVRTAIWDLEQTYDGGDGDAADAPGLDVQFEPFEGPVAAKGGNGGNKGGGGKGGGGGSTPTDITVDDKSIENIFLDENSAGGTLLGILDAIDDDMKERFTFTLPGDANGLFAISGKNRLVVADGANIDYEIAQLHTITIRVTDKQGNVYYKTMTISIVDDDSEAQNTAPTDMQLSDDSIPEGSANGTLVGVLTTTDADPNETFTYTLLDSAGGRFVMDGDRLEIADSSLIDFETGPTHDVTVRVTDSAGKTYEETFTIQIEDVTGLAEQPNYIQALIPAVGGEAYRFWPDGNTATAPTTITFTILTDFPSYYDPSNMLYSSGTVSFDQLTSAQLTVIYQLLAELEELVNVEFVYVASADDANITFGMYLMDSGIGAYAWYPSHSGSTGSVSGDIWLTSTYDTSPTTDDTIGADWARSTIAHELGHAMGLKHPGDYNAGGGGTPGPYLDPEVDNGQYTTMSYNDFPYSGYDPVDYMLYDIAALQYLYGANTDHATGDDVYVFDTGSKLIDTIWDAGGFDTFSAAGASMGVTIDLNQGGFSSIGLTDNIGIAYGTEIEAAIGGSGDDTLIGNSLDNTFTGGAGADTFVFADNWGFDTILDFEDGVDLIDLSGSGFEFFELLTIIDKESGAEIVAGVSTVVLSGIDFSLVDETDFVFA
ncbi:MAG: M10 family metallopeptidase C-terminal domain-containing protein [Limibaculum sp.]